MNTENIIEEKEIRDKFVDRVDILNKVKKLFLIPEMNAMTMKMVAEFYEVEMEDIKWCYIQNLWEISSDGASHKKLSEFKNIYNFNKPYKKLKNKCIFQYNNLTVEVPNAGLLVFSQRGVLRIGMLLHDSRIAQEFRTQLLNTFKHSTVEQKTYEINEETEIQFEIGAALMSGDFERYSRAVAKGFAYKNRNKDGR